MPRQVDAMRAGDDRTTIAAPGAPTLRASMSMGALSNMGDDTKPARAGDAEYHARAAALFAEVEATLDRWLQEDVIDIDTHRTGGLLELEFPSGSKIVLNTQPPLQEVWLAARSGGWHFRWADGRWVDTREGREFHAVLSQCASEHAGRALAFGASG